MMDVFIRMQVMFCTENKKNKKIKISNKQHWGNI